MHARRGAATWQIQPARDTDNAEPRPLLVRPEAQAGEGAMGFLLRRAEANALVLGRYVMAQDAARACAALRGAVAGLRGLSAPDSAGLAARYWNTRRPRYCPLCLQDSPVWRAEWDLVFCVACSVHQASLLDCCTTCSRPLRWRRESLVRCDCGADLRGASSGRASGPVLMIAARLTEAWCNGAAPASGHSAVENLLCRIWLLGAYGLGIGRKPQKLSNLYSVEMATQVVQAAAATLDEWPTGFFTLLDRVTSRYGDSASGRLANRFGGLYGEIFRDDRKDAFEDLRAAFERYVLERWAGQLAGRNRRIGEKVRNDHAWMPVARAAKELHWRPARLRTAIARGVVRGHLQARPSGRMAGVVHRDDLARLKQDAADWIDQSEVCRRLHLGKKSVKRLVESGALAPVAGPSVDGHPVWQFRRTEVDAAAGHCLGLLRDPGYHQQLWR